jgi:hypothetical protein
VKGQDSRAFTERLFEFCSQIINEGQDQAAIPWPLAGLEQPPNPDYS